MSVRHREEPRWSDWLVGLLIFTWAFAIFSGARTDFSYDYANYVSYLDRLGGFTSTDIWNSLGALIPYPYVLVPPSGLFEIGFVLLTWLMLSAGLSGAVVYSLIGALSIAMRVLLLRWIGMRWSLNALLAVYSITLFEANAIRLGCALTFMVGALLALLRNRIRLALMLIVAAALFHLQALAFSLPLIATYACFGLIKRSAQTRAIALGTIFLLSISATAVLQSLGFTKIADYVGLQSAATGLNAISLVASLAFVFGAVVFLHYRQTNLGKIEQTKFRVWGSVYLAACPSLALLLLATNMGAIGDRVWQFAFVLLVAVQPLLVTPSTSIKLYTATLWTCLVIAVISITFRYPLSNFFSPLIPYTPINPHFFIL